MRFVVRDRRYSSNSKEAWKVVGAFNPADYPEDVNVKIDNELQAHYQKNKEPLGYAPVRGLCISQLEHLLILSKSGKARLGITRWGDVHCYKLNR